MKVQCDGCGTEAASVFCCADEAALCDTCDRRVHRANKVARKHRRFSLLHPSSLSSSSAQPPPLCDICQEKRGLLFCKEDRAILCRDCDVPIHTSSDLTKKHTRFLLTGVRLSSAPITAGSAPSEIIEQEAEKQITITESNSYSSSKTISQDEARSCTGTAASNNSSSISNYLINMLPGWHVEEFLSGDTATGGVPTNAPFMSFSSNGFYQGEINPKGMSEEYPIWTNQEQNFYNGFAPKMNTSYTTLETWVPQIQSEFGTNKRQMPSSYHW